MGDCFTKPKPVGGETKERRPRALLVKREDYAGNPFKDAAEARKEEEVRSYTILGKHDVRY